MFKDAPGSSKMLQDAPGCSRMLQVVRDDSKWLQNAWKMLGKSFGNASEMFRKWCWEVIGCSRGL